MILLGGPDELGICSYKWGDLTISMRGLHHPPDAKIGDDVFVGAPESDKNYKPTIIDLTKNRYDDKT